MIDLKLDGNDLAIEGTDLALVTGGAQAAQHAKMRVMTYLAECVYDRGAGVPWTQVLMRRGATPQVWDATIRGVLAATPGVSGVQDLDLDYDREAQRATGRAVITTDDAGSVTLSLQVGAP